MIPLGDVVPTRTRPVMTVGLTALISAGFLYECALPPERLELLVQRWGLVPGHPSVGSMLASLMLHRGWVHVLGNAVGLWLFGRAVEDRLGHGRFVAFYLLCGLAAVLAQRWATAGSLLPLVGADGAVGGVIAAYLVLFPRSRVLTLVPVPPAGLMVEVPATFFLALWLLLRFAGGAGVLAGASEAVDPAVAAHAAGLLAGGLGGRLLSRPERLRAEWWDPA